MTDDTSRLVLLVPSDLAAGFGLTGVDTRTVEDATSAADELDRLGAAGDVAVIAVYEPIYDGLPADMRHRFERSLEPIVVPLPSGRGRRPGATGHARLMQRLQRAIGYHITFGGDEP